MLKPPQTEKSSRLQELADFVRKKREAISSEDVGIAKGKNRRVKGLRREEVAELAGISTDWYTWIEQGRDLNISTATVESLSKALLLDEQERLHLFHLAGHPLAAVKNEIDETTLAFVQKFVNSISNNPTYALDRFWNVIAWNAAAKEMFGDFGLIDKSERNILHLAFVGNDIRKIFLNWEDYTHCTIAHFRVDTVDDTDSNEWVSLVERLRKESAEFDQLWNINNVSWPDTTFKTIDHPTRGRLDCHSMDMKISRPAHMRIVSYILHD